MESNNRADIGDIVMEECRNPVFSGKYFLVLSDKFLVEEANDSENGNPCYNSKNARISGNKSYSHKGSDEPHDGLDIDIVSSAKSLQCTRRFAEFIDCLP